MIHLASNLTLPDDLVTKTVGILAQRRKGKTYTAAVIAEELVDAGIPFVVLDPTGAWWGLRSSADGTKPGLPVTILGGHHGDVPLERTAGKLVAELVVDRPGWYVLDLSLFESKEADRQFATDFAERLYRRKGQEGGDSALHLFVDEADLFVPQQSPSGDKRMVGAFETLVRRGGIRGIGTTLISQRAAVVNKNVLEMLDMLVVLRTVGPNDRKAIDGYIEAFATPDDRKAVMASLASLDIGEAWVYEPGEDLLARVHVRTRWTYNSSATPKAGEVRAEPQRLADVDLDALKEQMAETIEKADAQDPKKLQARIRDLERQLAARPDVEPERVVEVVEVHVLDAGLVEQLEAALARVDDAGRDLVVAADHVAAALGAAQRAEAPAEPTPSVPPAVVPIRQRTDPRPTAEPPDAAYRPRAGARRMLEALATYPSGLTISQVGTLAKIKKTGGTFSTYLSELIRNGLVTRSGDTLQATDAGIDAVGGVALPSDPAELRAEWRDRLKAAGAKRMFDELVLVYPGWHNRENLAAAVDLDMSGGTFSTYLSRLRSNQLIEERGNDLRAHPDLFMGER